LDFQGEENGHRRKRKKRIKGKGVEEEKNSGRRPGHLMGLLGKNNTNLVH